MTNHIEHPDKDARLSLDDVTRLLDEARATHAEDEELARFIDGNLGQTRSARLRGHLRDCAECREALALQVEAAFTERQAPPDDEGRTQTDFGGLVELLEHDEALVRQAAAMVASRLEVQDRAVTARMPLQEVAAAAAPPEATVLESMSSAEFALRDGEPRTLRFGTGETVLVVRTKSGRPGEASIETTAVGSTSNDVAIRLRAPGRDAMRFFDRRGGAAFPVPAGVNGPFRIEVAPLAARFEVPSTAVGAAAFTDLAAAAPVDHDSPNSTRRWHVDLPDGSLTIDVVLHPGGFLEIQTEAHDEQLRNGLVYAAFRTSDGDVVILRDEHGQEVEITIPLTLTKGGRPYGQWLRRIYVPEDALRLDVARFSKIE